MIAHFAIITLFVRERQYVCLTATAQRSNI